MTRPLVCRARFVLPLTDADPDERIADGYVLGVGDVLLEVGAYTPAIGQALVRRYGDRLQVMGGDLQAGDDPIPQMNGVLMPAFVKAHGHDHEQPLIGVAKDEPLTAWLDHAVNPFTGFMNAERVRWTERLGVSPQLATYRMARLVDIHYGITASMVHHCNYNKYHLEPIAVANEAAGTTMIVAVGSQDRHYVRELLDTPAEAIARLDHALELEPDLARTSFCPGPDQLFSNSQALLVPLKAWARRHGRLFHVHSSEEPNTTRWFTEAIEPGDTPVGYADRLGILDEHTVLAHQVNTTVADIEALARTGTKVVHNPLANTILGSGMPPLMPLIAAGVDVVISTDGSGSADHQNIIGAARLAAQFQKAHHQDATLLPSVELLHRITRAPAQMLGLNQGELAPGRQADWVVLDLSAPNMIPTRLDNVMENVIWAANGNEIDTVVARGRVLKSQGRVLPFVDGTTPETITRAVQELSEGFAAYRRTAEELRGTGAHH